jgi:hypothetical protein
MENASIGRLAHRKDAQGTNSLKGFSLLEMMMVVTVIFEAVSSQPSGFS